MSITLKLQDSSLFNINLSIALNSDMIERLLQESEFLQVNSDEQPIIIILSKQEVELFQSFFSLANSIKKDNKGISKEELALRMSQEFSFDTSSDDQILNYFKVADYFVSPLMEEAMNFKLAKMYSMGKNELEEMYGIKCEETYKKAQEEAYREYEDQMLAELYKIDPKFKDESIKLGRPFLC